MNCGVKSHHGLAPNTLPTIVIWRHSLACLGASAASVNTVLRLKWPTRSLLTLGSQKPLPLGHRAPYVMASLRKAWPVTGRPADWKSSFTARRTIVRWLCVVLSKQSARSVTTVARLLESVGIQRAWALAPLDGISLERVFFLLYFVPLIIIFSPFRVLLYLVSCFIQPPMQHPARKYLVYE